jgi:hypothetical protein
MDTQSERNTPAPPAHTTLADLELRPAQVVGSNAAGVTPAPKPGRKRTRKARKDNRFRCQFRFHLDANKPDEYAIGQELAALKKKRKYLPTIRDAIRLFLSLLKGETATLKEMFPLIVDQIEYEMIRQEADDDKDDLRKEIQSLRQDIAEQNKKIIPLFDNQGGLVMAGQKPSAAAMSEAHNTLGKGITFTAAPSEDDDDDTIEIKESASKPMAFENLLAGMLKMDERSEREYAERLAAGDIDPRTGRRLSTRLD